MVQAEQRRVTGHHAQPGYVLSSRQAFVVVWTVAAHLHAAGHQHHIPVVLQQPPHLLPRDGPDAPPPVQVPHQRHSEALH